MQFLKMMDLTSDAKPLNNISYDIAEKTISKDILEKIEDDLDIDEKMSILFLMLKDYQCAFEEVFDLYKRANEGSYILPRFSQMQKEKWEDAFLEALCVVQNLQIIRKLGICHIALERLYVPKIRLCSKNFCLTAKCLYAMCEGLNEDQAKQLLQLVKSDLPEYPDDLEITDILELHLLYWMKRKYISISPGDKVDLKNLLKHLKQFDGLELIYADLKTCENHQNVLDTNNVFTRNNCMPHSFSSNNENYPLAYVKSKDIKQIGKGLCIIINEIFFSGGKYETRFGTTADRDKLTETFKGFNFDVSVFENMTKDELLETLRNIPKKFGTSYDCIFVCILSHGCKGSIITADAEEVCIEALEKAICCLELTDVIKIVIVQACQGKLTGQMHNSVTVDGPGKSSTTNIASFRNFCLFMSTIQGYVSVRHKTQGSWFIQEFCTVLQNGGNELTFYDAVSHVMQSVEKKRGKLDESDDVAQLPELRSSRLLADFKFPKYQPQAQ